MSKRFEKVTPAVLKKATSKITEVVLSLLVVLVPLLILPLGENFLVASKGYILFIGALLLIGLWLLRTFFQKSLQLTLSPLLFPIALFGAAAILSTFLSPLHPVFNLLGLGGLYLAFVVIAILGPSLLEQSNEKRFITLLSIPTLILGIGSILEVVGKGPSLLINMLFQTQFPNSPMFNLTSSPIIAAELFGLMLVGLCATYLPKRQKPSLFHIVVGVISAIGLIINLNTLFIFQRTSSVFLPYSASWSILLDAMKASLRAALIGFGPESFSQLYLTFKPVWINQTAVWNIQFAQASSFLFNLVVTMGILGVIAWLLLIFQAIRSIKKGVLKLSPAAVVFMGAWLIQLFLPTNVVLLTIQVVSLVFWISQEKAHLKDVQLHTFTVHLVKSEHATESVPQRSHILVGSVCIIGLVALLLTSYGLARTVWADGLIFASNQAATQNQALQVYDLQQQAINFNPYSDLYRRKYSATNMAIASVLATTPNLAESDRQKAVILVQQAIQEGKAAVILNQAQSLNWVNLARIYTNLIGAVDQSDQWAFQSYDRALQAAPSDPLLHLEIGSLYTQLKKYDDAVRFFEQALTLKPDWANATFNLARVYRAKGENERALNNYQLTLNLLTESAPEYVTVKQEMEAYQKELSNPNAKKSATPPAQTRKPAEEEVNSNNALKNLPIEESTANLAPPGSTSSAATQSP